MDNFADIRQISLDRSDVAWVLKDYENCIPYLVNYKDKEFIRLSLFKSYEFKYDLKLISDKSGRDIADLVKEAEKIFDGMSHDLGMSSIRFMGIVLSKLLKSLYSGVMIEQKGIEKIREAHKDCTVILLPTHRSYADFLFISYIMFNFDLPLPVITAAMDFMNMKFVGELLRKCGAFFIRRSFVNDDLYWAVFSHYVKTLISLDQEPLEFFIEGTRSRTNKSLFPKMGLLGIILESWLSGKTKSDVALIPISICYDRILEEKLYAWELLGVPKPKESTRGLLQLRHLMKEDFGKVYFTVADPIRLNSVSVLFGGIHKYSHNLQLRFKPSLFECEKQFLHHLAMLIVHKQQNTLIISDFSLLSFLLLIAMYHHRKPIGREDGGVDGGLLITKDELIEQFQLLYNYLYSNQCPVIMATDNESLLSRMLRSISIHKALVQQQSHENQDWIVMNKEPGSLSTVSKSNMSKYVLPMALTNYRNQLLYHVTRESLLLLLLDAYECEDTTIITEQYKIVLQMLAKEIVYMEDINTNLSIAQSRLDKADINKKSNILFRNLLKSAIIGLLFSYHVYAKIIKISMNHSKKEDGNLNLKFIHAIVLKVATNDEISHQFPDILFVETLSTDKIKNFLHSLKHYPLKSSNLETIEQLLSVTTYIFNTQLPLSCLNSVIEREIAP